MGPIRRRLIYAGLALYSTPLAAEVCDKERPPWAPSDGPMTMIGEVSAFFTSHLGIVILIATLLSLVFHLRVLSFVASALTTLMILIIYSNNTFPDPSGVREFAIKEGCIGPPHLLIAVLIAICCFNLWNCFLRKKKTSKDL